MTHLARSNSSKLEIKVAEHLTRSGQATAWMAQYASECRNEETGRKLPFDFFSWQLNTVIEVQGKQHAEYVPHFHGNRVGFVEQLRRDRMKREWAGRKGLTVIEIWSIKDMDKLDQIGT